MAFWPYLKRRASISAKIAVCVVFDSALFCIWLAIACGVHVLAKKAEALGVHEVFAQAFNWVTSVGTLIVTVVYIIKDIIEAIKDM